jgi:hypothetical protein
MRLPSITTSPAFVFSFIGELLMAKGFVTIICLPKRSVYARRYLLFVKIWSSERNRLTLDAILPLVVRNSPDVCPFAGNLFFASDDAQQLIQPEWNQLASHPQD